jgi:hypothetical protein
MKRSLVTWLVASKCRCACVGSGEAQTASPPATLATPQVPVKDPVATALRAILQRSRNNILGVVTAMPAGKFNYKPTPDQKRGREYELHY